MASEDLVQHDCVIGIDVHSRKLVCCAMWTENGEVRKDTAEFQSFRNDLRKMASWCAAHKPEIVLMESTGIYWKSPFYHLEQQGLVAVVVNARHIKGMVGKKTDIKDAEWLAHVGRLGCFNRSFIPSSAYQDLRVTERSILKITDDLAAYKNRLSKALTDAGFRLNLVFSDIHGENASRAIDAILEGMSADDILNLMALDRLKADPKELKAAFEGRLSRSHKKDIESIRNIIAALTAEIIDLKDFLLKEVINLAGQRTLLLLQTLPGVSEDSAVMILIELGGGGLETFATGDRLASWLGVCPGNNESAGKRRSGHIRKGNYYLRRILCECANAAVRSKGTTFRSKYQSIKLRLGHKRALITIVNKMVHMIFIVLTKRKEYRDPLIDYSKIAVAKNGKRWIKALIESELWDIKANNRETGEQLANC